MNEKGISLVDKRVLSCELYLIGIYWLSERRYECERSEIGGGVAYACVVHVLLHFHSASFLIFAFVDDGTGRRCRCGWIWNG